jgi:hypothetical protein
MKAAELIDGKDVTRREESSVGHPDPDPAGSEIICK